MFNIDKSTIFITINNRKFIFIFIFAYTSDTWKLIKNTLKIYVSVPFDGLLIGKMLQGKLLKSVIYSVAPSVKIINCISIESAGWIFLGNWWGGYCKFHMNCRNLSPTIHSILSRKSNLINTDKKLINFTEAIR